MDVAKHFCCSFCYLSVVQITVVLVSVVACHRLTAAVCELVLFVTLLNLSVVGTDVRGLTRGSAVFPKIIIIIIIIIVICSAPIYV